MNEREKKIKNANICEAKTTTDKTVTSAVVVVVVVLH
jgi:hypothetical protein